MSNARKCAVSSASPYRSRIASRNISPIASDSDISIVVWFAQPTRVEIAIRVETGGNCRRETREKGLAVSSTPDVVADDTRLVTVEHDEITPAGELQRLRRRGARLFVTHFAVNDRGETLAGVARDVLPDVQHRSAGRIDEGAALLGELRHVPNRDAERRQDDDVLGAECLAAVRADPKETGCPARAGDR